MQKLVTLIISAIGVAAFGGTSMARIPHQNITRDYTCEVDLTNNTSTCLGAVTVQSLANSQALLSLDLSRHQFATFDINYCNPLTGYTVDVGDSSTNNGNGGDAATQSNDAETQVFTDATGTALSAFGRDGTPSYPSPLIVANHVVEQGSSLRLAVSDEHINWSSAIADGALGSKWLYALAGQPDTEGPVNRAIFAAFNRVIAGDTTRTGTGVCTVLVHLTRAPCH